MAPVLSSETGRLTQISGEIALKCLEETIWQLQQK